MTDPRSSLSDQPEASSHTIASTLRAARQEQGRTLSHAATTLRLPVPDLAELERQNDATVVADVHTMARLRVYGRHLGLDPERMLTDALQARDRARDNEPQEEPTGQSATAAPARETLPPPPATGESRGKRVSGTALLVILGIVTAVGTAAAAVVFNEQPQQQVQLSSPGQEQTDAEGERQAQALDSDDDLTAADEGPDLGAADEDTEDPSLGAAAEDTKDAETLDDGENGDASAAPAGSPSSEDDASHPSGDPAAEAESRLDGSEGETEQQHLPGRPPEQTSVQVLDGAGAPETRDAVLATLEDHGYVVAAVNAARTPREQSVVFYSEGWEDEAEALAAREDRLVVSDENPGFSEDIGLHVVVGADWPR